MCKKRRDRSSFWINVVKNLSNHWPYWFIHYFVRTRDVNNEGCFHSSYRNDIWLFRMACQMYSYDDKGYWYDRIIRHTLYTFCHKTFYWNIISISYFPKRPRATYRIIHRHTYGNIFNLVFLGTRTRKYRVVRTKLRKLWKRHFLIPFCS